MTDAPKDPEAFVAFILGYYAEAGRKFPWRETDEVYPVFLSEVMLQQTGTERVKGKYADFLSRWPTFRDLAEAPFAEVLDRWRGLGYNRRALALWHAAQASGKYGWTLPPDEKELLSLPGVGPSTAAAVLCFCYHEKAVYLETNVRRVMIHTFHAGEDGVPEKTIRQELQDLLAYVDDPKTWYYALMDWGVHLKGVIVNPNTHSRVYRKQSKFEGSRRQVRGLIVHILSESGKRTGGELCELLPFERDLVDDALAGLVKDGLVAEEGGAYRIR